VGRFRRQQAIDAAARRSWAAYTGRKIPKGDARAGPERRKTHQLRAASRGIGTANMTVTYARHMTMNKRRAGWGVRCGSPQEQKQTIAE